MFMDLDVGHIPLTAERAKSIMAEYIFKGWKLKYREVEEEDDDGPGSTFYYFENGRDGARAIVIYTDGTAYLD